MSTLISLDCESNGLHGQIFAAAAAIYRDGVEVDTWEQRCPIVGRTDEWVDENVLPALAHMPITCAESEDIVALWRLLYSQFERGQVLVLAHIPWPIETRFLWEAHKAQPFSGPYPLLDLASMLHAHGEDATSEDSYMEQHGLTRPEGRPHHPLNDARAAALVYFHLTDWPVAE